jgi:hypothetical protein
MPKEPFKVTCPDCKTILVIDAKTGEIIEKRKPIIEDTTGDRLKDAFLKAKQREDEADVLFQKAKEKERERKSKLDSIFKESVEKAKEEDDCSKPMREMDL